MSAAACKNHLDREAIGICVECRARICSECVTKVDGINYCVACYATLADRGARKRDEASGPSAPWVTAAGASGLFVVAVMLVWGLLEVALP